MDRGKLEYVQHILQLVIWCEMWILQVLTWSGIVVLYEIELPYMSSILNVLLVEIYL